jgi:hypothetical protein
MISDRLTQLAVMVLDAKSERGRAANARLNANPDDAEPCDLLDDAADLARRQLEAALWDFFSHWLALEVESNLADEELATRVAAAIRSERPQ